MKTQKEIFDLDLQVELTETNASKEVAGASTRTCYHTEYPCPIKSE